jgi:hypothetical protein
VKLGLVGKENQTRVDYTVMNRLKDPVIKIHTVSRVMCLQFMHYCTAVMGIKAT